MMKLFGTSPFGEAFEPLLSLQRALDRAMSEDFFGLSTTSKGAFPPVSVFKGESGLTLRAELPGVRREDIQVEVEGDLVRLSGERRPDYDRGEVSIHRKERAFGRFDRTLRLPIAVAADQVRADYADGVLTVQLPLAESAKPKRIAIN
jgi:HSP20 family protein